MAFDFASFDLPPRIMPRIKEWEIIFDICYLFHIVLTFFTSFQHDLEWVEQPKDIAVTYLKSYFFIDVLTTIPPMIMQQIDISSELYWLKILRFVHFGNFLAIVKRKMHSFLFKVGLDGQQITRFIYFIILMLYLVYVIHVLSCFWVLLGFLWNSDGSSWFKSAGLPPSTYKNKENYYDTFESIAPIYIRALYFIVTSLTTVGYGDVKGVTNYELLF